MQNHTGELTRSLADKGVKQTVVTTRPPGASRRSEFAPGAEVIRLGWNVRRFRQLYSVAAFPLMNRLGADADLVHIHLGEDLAVIPLGMLAARDKELPIVLTVHCSPKHTVTPTDLRSTFLNRIGGRIEERGERIASAVITITWRLANKLVEQGVDPQKIHVIPSGARPSLFEEPRIDPIPDIRRPRIGFVGRLTEAKGIFDLLDAFELLTHEAQLVYVGDGPERGSLETEIANRELNDRVHVTGFVAHDRVPDYLQHLDLLTLPSHYEELGSILIEALQVGLPLVGAETGGIPEVIDHGHNGMLFPPKDAKGLADALDKLLWNPDLRRLYGEASFRKAPLYDWTQLADRVLNVYEHVVARKPIAV